MLKYTVFCNDKGFEIYEHFTSAKEAWEYFHRVNRLSRNMKVSISLIRDSSGRLNTIGLKYKNNGYVIGPKESFTDQDVRRRAKVYREIKSRHFTMHVGYSDWVYR